MNHAGTSFAGYMQQPHMARLKAIKEQNVDSTTLGKIRLEA